MENQEFETPLGGPLTRLVNLLLQHEQRKGWFPERIGLDLIRNSMIELLSAHELEQKIEKLRTLYNDPLVGPGGQALGLALDRLLNEQVEQCPQKK